MNHEEAGSITNKIAAFIKEKRLARGESLREFSKTVFGDEKHHEWIRKIEQGRGITVKTLETFFEALNCDIAIIEN